MGTDIKVYLLQGFKLPLSVAFKLKLLDPEILNSDDYQYLSYNYTEKKIVDKHVISPILKEILKDKWQISILTSSQDDSDPDTSYLFLFNWSQEIHSGRFPDYKTGKVNKPFHGSEIIAKCKSDLNKISATYLWNYDLHWVVEGSY